MKFLALLTLFCLLLRHSLAKKSYWESALNEVYGHASEASEKLTKASAKAYDHVSKAINSPKVPSAYESAVSTASQLGQKAAEVSSAAYESVNQAINSPEVTKAYDSVVSTASQLGQKAAEVSSVAYESVSQAINSPEVASAYESAVSTASQLGQKAVEVSSAAYESINQAINSPEAAQAASDAYTTAGQLGKKAVEASTTAFESINQAIKSGDLKKQVAQAASTAYAGAETLGGQLRQGLSELSKGRQEGETWTGYFSRVAPQLVYAHEEDVIMEEKQGENDEVHAEIVEEETVDGDGVVREKKVVKEDKLSHLADYIFFWRDLNATSFRDSASRFSKRFYYGEDEDEKRAANIGYAAAIRETAGVFEKINKHGRNAIYSLKSGLGWGMRQINTAGKTPIYKPSLFGSTLNHFGSLFWYGSVVAETVNVANAAAKDLDEGTSTNTVRASSKAVGSWTGAAVGASAGATIFSVVPVVGTLAGGIVGGFTGAYAGEKVGEAAATAYAENAKARN